MISEIIFVISIFLYMIFQGIIESDVAKLNRNIDINTGQYHIYRLYESISLILGFIAISISKLTLYHAIYLIVGSWILGLIIYEKILNLRLERIYWISPYSYSIGEYNIILPTWLPIVQLLVGIGLIGLVFI